MGDAARADQLDVCMDVMSERLDHAGICVEICYFILAPRVCTIGISLSSYLLFSPQHPFLSAPAVITTSLSREFS